jgi:hypothetical protein
VIICGSLYVPAVSIDDSAIMTMAEILKSEVTSRKLLVFKLSKGVTTIYTFKNLIKIRTYPIGLRSVIVLISQRHLLCKVNRLLSFHLYLWYLDSTACVGFVDSLLLRELSFIAIVDKLIHGQSKTQTCIHGYIGCILNLNKRVKNDKPFLGKGRV